MDGLCQPVNGTGMWRLMRAGGALAWQAGPGILVYALLFGLLAGFVVLPPLLGLLSVLGQHEGSGIVGNYTVLPWILSGRGAAWGLLLLSSSIFLLVSFLAGLFLLLAQKGEALVLRDILLGQIVKRLPEVLSVSVRWSLITVAALLVLGLVPGLGFLVFLREHDINYYLKSRPPEWWLAIGSSAAWILGVGFVLLRCLLRISLLFPLWARNRDCLRRAARESWALSRGHERRLAGLAAWAAGVVFLAHTLLGLLIFGSMEALLPRVANSVHGTVSVIAGGLLVFVVESFAALCAYAAWTSAIWSLLCRELSPGLTEEARDAAPTGRERIRALHALVLAGACAALAAVIFRAAADLPRQAARPRTLVIAHRGGAGEAPENSMEAFGLALAHGLADMLEMDVAMTADGVLILAHDSDLMRQAGEPRKLADIGWDELSRLTLKTPQSKGRQFAPVARLEDALRLIGKRRPAIVEFKHSKRTPALVPATVAAVRDLGMMEDILFMSLDLADLRAVQALAPEARVGYFVSVEMGDFLDLNLHCIAPRHTLVTRKVVADSRARGIPVFAWTVDDPARVLELLELGVDGLITNEPSRVRKVVDAYFRIPAEVRSLLRFRRLWSLLMKRREFRSLADMAGEEFQP